MKNLFITGALCSALILSGCSEDNSDKTYEIVDSLYTTISGNVTTFSNATDSEPVPDAVIEAVYTSPSDPNNPKTSSDANGDFSLNALKNNTFYLHVTKNDYAILNSTFATLTADKSNISVIISTLTKTQGVIDTSLADTTDLVNHAWLVVAIVDANGDDVGGQLVTTTPAPDVQAYIECNGTSDTNLTVTEACNNNTEPMYIAYYDAPLASINVTVGSETQSAPVRMGEVSVFKFEQ